MKNKKGKNEQQKISTKKLSYSISSAPILDKNNSICTDQKHQSRQIYTNTAEYT